MIALIVGGAALLLVAALLITLGLWLQRRERRQSLIAELRIAAARSQTEDDMRSLTTAAMRAMLDEARRRAQ
jgi:hypothetical protein